MVKNFSGPALFLDRSDINTDEIIPARYLTEVTKEALQPYLLEDLKLEGFDPRGAALARAAVVVARRNFGCGSSREHAAWAFEVNGINTLIAAGYSRIFRQNMFNCGMLAIELPEPELDKLFALAQQGEVRVAVDLDASRLSAEAAGERELIPFELSAFDRALVQAGGWVEFADQRY